MKEKRYKKQEKGITLIALIITIIVMLILVAVTIQVTISGGIFEKAGEAVGKTKNSMNEEEEIMDKWVEKIDRIENGPNAPELIEGMIPVEWNKEKKAWVKADANTDDWYEYGTTAETKKWANAVTVKAEGTKAAAAENLIAGSKTREQYQEAEAGTSILQDDILGMYVWIPRYAYKIPNENYHTSNAGIIDIKFIGGIKDTISDGKIVEYNAETTIKDGEPFSKFPDGYVIHPAFNVDTGSGIKRLSGIWVAKFEASSSNTSKENPNIGDKYGSSKGLEYNVNSAETIPSTVPKIGSGEDEVTIRPNVTSWRGISVQNMYIACTNMVKTGNIQGISIGADGHLMKDTEWGAVAYLTQSKYGNPQNVEDENSGIWINSYFEGDGGKGTTYGTTRTGMVGIKEGTASGRDIITEIYSYETQESKEARKNPSEDGSITIEYQLYDRATREDKVGEKITNMYYTYETKQGQHGSTTGTIYGVYDMAGGAWEYQASYMTDKEKANKGWAQNMVEWFDENVDKEHKTTYTASTSSNIEVYKINNDKYGNGVWETSNNLSTYWFGKDFVFVRNASPFEFRGGAFFYGSSAGIFSFSAAEGTSYTYSGFRPVLIP